MDGLTVAGVAALIALFTTNAVQLLKPYVEMLPGLTLAKNQTLHDHTLRLLSLSINLGALALFAVTTPVFVGMPWWQIVLIGFGQGGVSHYTYSTLSSGGTPFSDAQTYSGPTVTSGVVQTGQIPIIPRS